MNEKEPIDLSDQELVKGSKRTKPSPIIDAFFIGFLIGIILYSAFMNTWGFLTLIPLFMVYRLTKKSKGNEAIKKDEV